MVVQLDALRFAGLEPMESPYLFDEHGIDQDALVAAQPGLVVFDDPEMLSWLREGEGKKAWPWSGLRAIAGDDYVVSPGLLHSWFGNMVFSQTIGLQWLCNCIWPYKMGFNTREKAIGFYWTFFEVELGMLDLLGTVGTYDLEGYTGE